MKIKKIKKLLLPLTSLSLLVIPLININTNSYLNTKPIDSTLNYATISQEEESIEKLFQKDINYMNFQNENISSKSFLSQIGYGHKPPEYRPFKLINHERWEGSSYYKKWIENDFIDITINNSLNEKGIDFNGKKILLNFDMNKINFDFEIINEIGEKINFNKSNLDNTLKTSIKNTQEIEKFSFFNIKKNEIILKHNLDENRWITDKTIYHESTLDASGGVGTGEVIITGTPAYFETWELRTNNNINQKDFNQKEIELADFYTFSNINFKNIFSINVNEQNKYSNNGKAYKNAPLLNIGFNKEFVKPIQELYYLKNLYNDVLDAQRKIHSSNERYSWYTTILDNIKNLSKTYNENLNDFKNIEKIAPIAKNEKNKLFTNFENLDGRISNNIDNWDFEYKFLLFLLKNNSINVSYLTKNSPNEIKNTKIWDGNKFKAIEASDSITSNSNYIELKNINYINNDYKINSNNLNIDNIKLDFNKNEFPNFSLNNNSIKYEFLYSYSNKYYTNDYYIPKESIDLRAIEIPFNKLASQIIKKDNTFINNLYVRDMLNKVLYDNNASGDQRILFSNLVDVNFAFMKELEHYNKALEKFGLTLNNRELVDFTPNNKDGTFYGIAVIKEWLFDDEKDTDEVHGNFTKEFLNKMNNNKDIHYMGTRQNQGFFLVQMKTNKTSNVEKNLNEIPSINDDVIGDYIPNQNGSTIEQLKIIKNDNGSPLNVFGKHDSKFYSFVAKELVDQANWKTIEETKDNGDGTSTITYKKELDLDKEISYNFNNFEFEHGLYNELWRGEYPKDTLQEMRKVIWNASLNASNENTNKGLIVSRIHTGKTQYKLNDLGEKIWDNTTMDWAIEPIYNYVINDQYKDNFVVTDDEDFINTNTIVGNYSLSNIDDSSFAYKFKIGELINMYEKYSLSDDYKDDFNNNWNPIKTALEKAAFSEIKNNKTENKNNYSSKNNNLALSISLPIIIGIMIASIATFLIIKRKESKKI